MATLSLLLRVIFARTKLFLWMLLFLVLIGEAWHRLPFVPSRLEYAPDPEFGALLAGDQKGFQWLANLSEESPTISLNRLGFRGPPPGDARCRIAVVGDSEGLGVGVSDEEVWTAVFAAALNAEFGPGIEVQNACQPGHGPQFHARMLERIVKTLDVDILVLRVSIQDRHFAPLSEDRIKKAYGGSLQRQEIRKVTRFLPFIASKLQAQLPSLERAIIPPWLREEAPAFSGFDAASGEAMWHANAESWRRAAALAQERGIPLLFCLYDPIGSEASSVLKQRLIGLTKSYDKSQLLVLEPKCFGLDGYATPESRAEVLKRELVLLRDPHANAAQHRMMGNATFEALRQSGWIAPNPR